MGTGEERDPTEVPVPEDGADADTAEDGATVDENGKRTIGAKTAPAGKKAKVEPKPDPTPEAAKPTDWFKTHSNEGKGDCAFLAVAQASMWHKNKVISNPDQIKARGSLQTALRCATAKEIENNPTHYLPLESDVEECVLQTGTGGKETETPALHALAVTQKFEIRVWNVSAEGS